MGLKWGRDFHNYHFRWAVQLCHGLLWRLDRENCQSLSWSAPTCGPYGSMACCTELANPVKLTQSLLMCQWAGRWVLQKTVMNSLRVITSKWGWSSLIQSMKQIICHRFLQSNNYKDLLIFLNTCILTGTWPAQIWVCALKLFKPTGTDPGHPQVYLCTALLLCQSQHPLSRGMQERGLLHRVKFSS